MSVNGMYVTKEFRGFSKEGPLEAANEWMRSAKIFFKDGELRGDPTPLLTYELRITNPGWYAVGKITGFLES